MSLEAAEKVNRAADVLAAVRISDVYRELTGIAPKHHRGVAVWRGGAGFSVSLSDPKGVWFDHAAGEGGGIIGLVSTIRGCDGPAALRWLANFAGISLDDRPLSPTDRVRYARERRARERDHPIADLWQRAACALAQQVLADLKATLFDPVTKVEDRRPLIAEIQSTEVKLARWSRLSRAALVAEYRVFLKHHPTLTSGMVKAAFRKCEEECVGWRLLGVIE